ncbi:hypothetical protein [Hymenobacter sp. BT730]|uniref:hypothetical protein n=1 Tax=Hymenobacter sp. BT730 TaxID=3063332 RepID=UPI0026E09B12|nr:hypothetical protein [Hymenobacter sp. BT730]
MLFSTRFLLILSLFGLLQLPALAQPSLTPAQWRQDLQIALDSFLLKDRTFSPAAASAFRTRLTQLRDSAELKTTPQLLVGLAKALALSGNGHTRLYLLRNRTELRRYPIRVWWFPEGLYIVKTTPEHASLLGARIELLAGQKPMLLRRQVASLYAGSPTWADYMSTYTLTSPEILQGLGLVGADGMLTIQVKDKRGRRQHQQLAPLPFQRTTQPTEAWWDLAPGHPGRGATWQSALPTDTTRLPLYLRRPQQQYWMQYLPADKTLYVQYNRAGNQPGVAPLDSLRRRVLTQLRQQPVSKVVVDLRFNTGGNLLVGAPFFDELATASKKRGAKLYVLSGRATFSAAIFHVAQLRLDGATVVGEPAGDAMDFWAEGGNLILPNSGLALHYANRFHSYSPTPHPNLQPADILVDIAAPDITPTVPVQVRAKDYFAGRDPLLETVLKR